jgi:hypothetical protein
VKWGSPSAWPHAVIRPQPMWGRGETVGVGKPAAVPIAAQVAWSEGARRGCCFEPGSVTADLGWAKFGRH